MGRFSDLLNKITDNTIKPGDEDTLANNPRNALADAVNPMLDATINKILPQDYQASIPKMTVADDKRYYQELPQMIAAGTMGTVQSVDNAIGNVANRFGKIIQMGENNIPQNLGKVSVIPSAADQAAENLLGKTLKATSNSEALANQYGEELAKRKQDMLKGLISPDAYNSFKQEMMNKIRSGQ